MEALEQVVLAHNKLSKLLHTSSKIESQKGLDPGLAKPYSWLNLGFENTDLG